MLRKKRTLWEEEEKVEKNWSIENVANIFFFWYFFFTMEILSLDYHNYPPVE